MCMFYKKCIINTFLYTIIIYKLREQIYFDFNNKNFTVKMWFVNLLNYICTIKMKNTLTFGI